MIEEFKVVEYMGNFVIHKKVSVPKFRGWFKKSEIVEEWRSIDIKGDAMTMPRYQIPHPRLKSLKAAKDIIASIKQGNIEYLC